MPSPKNHRIDKETAHAKRPEHAPKRIGRLGKSEAAKLRSTSAGHTHAAPDFARILAVRGRALGHVKSKD